jgi:hypothetical protein
MKNRIAGVLLLLFLAAPLVYAQRQETVDSNESTASTETVTTSTSSTSVTTQNTSAPASSSAPAWMHMVRLAAIAGPFGFLVLAWLVGGYMHLHLVRREQAQFPIVRGTRSPQAVPMMISAALFFAPALLFIVFEVRSRMEIGRGIGGVVDEWHPVTAQAWTSLVLCLVLALIPWLFVRRADTVR